MKQPVRSSPSLAEKGEVELEIMYNRYLARYDSGQHVGKESDVMQRYLFLDIDGVLNTMRYSNYLIDHDEDDTDEDGALFDPEAVKNLDTIINNIPDVKIIISSTWRFKGWDWMNRLWEKRQLPGKIYSFTPGLEFTRFVDIIHQKYSESVYPYGTRGLEIGEWLRLNASMTSMQYSYVILDDCDDFPSYYQEHVILTDPILGITKETVDQVLEKLL